MVKSNYWTYLPDPISVYRSGIEVTLLLCTADEAMYDLRSFMISDPNLRVFCAVNSAL